MKYNLMLSIVYQVIKIIEHTPLLSYVSNVLYFYINLKTNSISYRIKICKASDLEVRVDKFNKLEIKMSFSINLNHQERSGIVV